MHIPLYLRACTFPLFTLLTFGGPQMRCAQVEPASTDTAKPVPPAPPGPDISTDNLPFFGFNAKGTVNTARQVQYANAFFDQLDPQVKRNMAVRVTGGTQSQETYGPDWTDDMIGDWAALQKRQGVRFIFVVNGNDSPANQAALIQRWLNAGARFDFLEMMNEYYLPKFANGDTRKAEVTQKITPEKYVDEILPAFWQELDQFKLPYYLIFAPAKDNQSDDRMEDWNKAVAAAVNGKYASRDLNATIHLYLRGQASAGNFDYGQIDRLRASLPKGRHIAVTEAGIIDPAMDLQQMGPATITHERNILAHLRPGDYLLDQVLYNPGKRNNTTILSDLNGGETAKGKAVLQFIQGGLK